MWGLDGTQYYPPHLSAYSKGLLGWARPIELTRGGFYRLEASCYSDTYFVIKHNFPSAQEFLIIENRHSCGFDRQIRESGGLAIYHVDETNPAKITRNTGGYMDYESNPNNPVPRKGFPTNHYRVAVLQADGRSQLEWHNGRGTYRDLFRAYDSTKGVNYIGDDGIRGFDEDRKPMRRAWPNTKSYMNGHLKSTGITISEISKPGRFMDFVLSAPGMSFDTKSIPISTPTMPPVVVSRRRPIATGKPSLPPTPKPSAALTPAPVVQLPTCRDMSGPLRLIVGKRRSRPRTFRNGCESLTNFRRCALQLRTKNGFAYEHCPVTCFRFESLRERISRKCVQNR
mmetsp:Transcript_19086/g.29009  ORF Transcript_19086/g.29009 Transcript_19086/m.29009 type:complete len:341 (+) Transcript_19086:68-1090(+)